MAIPSKRSPVGPGQKLAGKYRVEREIGAGSMGVVVEAWHIELDQRVAIKFLYPEFASNQEGAERFRREARASARIESEHVAKVLDIGTMDEGRTLYYVMEFLRGHDLSRELALHGPVPVRRAVEHIVQTCDALAEAHAKGIVHRDLKPANLFLVERPSGEQIIKVLDFGISKITEGTAKQFSLTDTSILMGSPAYMCPEQLESSRNVDGRADIWSLGVILHELILGQVPFRGDSVPQLVRSILLGLRDPITSRGGVPSDLEVVVERCLRQNRDERFDSIDELREALLPFSGQRRQTVPLSLPPAALGRDAASAPNTPLVASPDAPGLAAAVAAPRGTPTSSRANEPAPSAWAPISRVTAAPEAAESHPPLFDPEAPQTEGLQSIPYPLSWGRTQRGQSWRQAMYRRGLPAALFATLALSGVYWVLRSPVAPPATSAPATNAARALERSALLPPAPSEKPGEPLIRPLQPAPNSDRDQATNPGRDGDPARAEPAATPPTTGEPPRERQQSAQPEIPAPRPSAPATISAAPETGKRLGVPNARPADAKPAAPSSAGQDLDTEKSSRLPGFLRRLDGQDYGGRE